MSLFRLPALRSIASRMGLFGDRRWGGRSERSVTERSFRHLLIDPLEQRQLLSLSPGDIQQQLVNETLGANFTTGAQSVAVDSDGDFVVAWTRYDNMVDDQGNPVLDPITGLQLQEANIYARYFTDEVQQITLPDGVLTDALSGAYARFSLGYNGNEIQKLTLSATYAPSTYLGGMQPLIVGQFRLGLDLNGNGVISSNESVMVDFDENLPLTQTAQGIQTGLRGLGGALGDVVVKPISPHEYEIHFGDASTGRNMPSFQIMSGFTTFTSGFLPAVTVSTVREPGVVANIPVSPTNPSQTANAIKSWFAENKSLYSYAPVDFLSPEEYIPGPPPALAPPYTQPVSEVRIAPEVSVRALSATQFEITFVGLSGKINQPQLKITAVQDEAGNSLLGSSQINVTTVKETSPEFRVNDPELDDPFTPGVDKFDQIGAAVAMDADGDFVVTWQSVVPDTIGQEGRVTDIYARRFSPAGYVDPANVGFVQGVRALGNQFLVNTTTNGAQTLPDVGMDDNGNFVIVWETGGQDGSFFNGVRGQRYDRDGNRLGNEWLVSIEDTTSHLNPFVSMSFDGHFAISWTRLQQIVLDIYTPDGNSMLAGPAIVMPGIDSSSAFDTGNNLLLVAESQTDTDLGGSLNSFGVHMMMVELYQRGQPFTPDNVSLTITRPRQRVNSAQVTGALLPAWPHDQISAQAGLDADGDIYVTYDGYGPDVAQGYGMTETELDLLLENLLIAQANTLDDVALGAYRAQQEQLLLLDLLRGESSGVMLGYFDADPYGVIGYVNSDSVLNAQRDGHNYKVLITMSRLVDGGNFVVRLSRGGVSGYEDIGIGVATAGDPAVLDPQPTADNIDNALEAALRTGTYDFWPEDDYMGSISVRVVGRGELTRRAGTEWDMLAGANDVVFEVTFLGESHDWPFMLTLAPNGGHLSIGDVDDIAPNIYDYQAGDPGTTQTFSGSGVEPDGDLTIAWTQYERFTDMSDYLSNPNAPTNIYYRRMNESTDTAGPMLTDFLLADGTRLPNGGNVVAEMSYVVVTFDEELSTTGANSVKNLANWSLLKNGAPLTGGIREIQFGMNMSTTLGLNVVGSNKWEAVLFFDGNGVGAGTPSLGGGDYQIVASNAIRDMVGNALGRTGYNIQGASASRSFYLMPPTGGETPVNSATSGDQVYVSPAIDPATIPNSPRSTAGDVDGDYVVVWTDTTATNRGVWAKVQRTEWTKVGTARVSNTTTVKEFRVTSNPTASYASVARDGDGDFVVTWSQYDSVTGWDVWYRRFDAVGNAVGDAQVANTETDLAQRYSTVAMDNDGDFIIAWQSEDQDGNGYGIYAQRYDRAGERVGGIDEIQVLSLVGEVETATFTLDFDGLITGEIKYRATDGLAATAAQIEAAFTALGIVVDAEPLNERDIAIQFLGDYGRKDVVPLVINSETVQPNGGIEIIMAVEGVSSEFRVNDTVGGNQVFPSVAMDAQGDYIVSWTSSGQNGDAAQESNVYAKRFGVGEEIISPTQRLARLAEAWNWTPPEGVQVVPFIVSSDDPDNHLVYPGQGYDGVVELFLERPDGDGIGSGTLLSDGFHILTAAHNVCDDFGNLVATNVQVVFWIAQAPFVVAINTAAIYVHPDYNGSPWAGGADLAVLVLETRAPDSAQRYDIYRGETEIGQVFHKFGYGRWGTGDQGDVNDPDDWMREGWNKWEATGEMLAQILGEHYSADGLMYDFDGDGYDTFGTMFGMPDAGTGEAREICGAPGDSGGPSFLTGNLIAGVTSYGIVIGQPDPVAGLNSSFSDIGVDQRVSIYADWIDAMSRVTPEFLVNTTTIGNQKWSSVAMDADGDYVITWSSYGNDGGGSGYGAGYGGQFGVFAQRYTAGNIPVGGEIRVNTFTSGNQQHSQVAMDADGDFIIVWESFQDRPTGAGPDAASSYGVYAQRYVANSKLTGSGVLPNGRLGGEFRVNTTTAGDQRFPGVLLSAAGDAVVTWVGPGVGDTQGVFTQRYEVVADKTGPVVTDVLEAGSGTLLAPIPNDKAIDHEISKLVVCFGENVSTAYSTSGATSVVNPANWSLTRFGTTVTGAVRTVDYKLNQATGKYEAELTLNQSLGDGSYVLTLSSSVQDLFGNRLDGNVDGTVGDNFSLSFAVQTTPLYQDDIPVVTQTVINPRTYPESPNAIASDADGDHVIVWTATTTLGDGKQRDKVYAQRYNTNGTVQGSAIQLTASATAFALDDQRYASVAMDADGDFVVTWTNYRDSNPNVDADGDGDKTNDQDEADIYARRYRADGTALGDAFRVNLYTTNAQKWSDVAMDTDGDFVVTWASLGQEDNQQLGQGYGIYARRFDSFGKSLGCEFAVNVTKMGSQRFPSIAMDATGDFVIAWTSSQAIDGDDIIARAFKANGSPMPIDNSLALVTQPIGIHGGEILVNTTTAGDQRYCDVAMDMTGQRFVVAWSSWGKDTSGYGVYARRLTLNTTGYVVPDTRDPFEFRVNSSTTWNQMYPSVAMEWDGSFIVTWSGYGTRPGEADTSGYGVFYQRYDALAQVVGGETRANVETQGNQWFSSVACDANGNFVLAWTGVGQTTGSTNVYRFLGKSRFPAADTTGPIVTDILSAADRSRLIQDASLETSGTGISSLIVVFSENLSVLGGTSGVSSVLNPSNWVLERNGVELPLAVSKIDFQYNSVTRKYEATLTFDSNGVNPGTPALVKGEYLLSVRDSVTDGVNRLDGDYDAVPGTVPTLPGLQGFSYHFSVADTPNLGPEYRVNKTTSYEQSSSATLGMGMGLEGTNRSVAIDHDGDFVVVWTSYGEDDPSDPSGAGVYMRVFDRNNVALTDDVLVNTYTIGHQRNAEVAMDADGDFVIVWESQGQDRGGSYGIFGQRFSATGKKVGGEFRVNTEYTGDQTKPAVAMNNNGDFVVTYASSHGQNFSYFHELLGQRFNHHGEPVGVEFMINQTSIPGLPTEAYSQMTTNSAVAMDENGGFVVTWETFTAQADGIIFDSVILARMYNPDGSARTNEFRVDVSTISGTGQDTRTDPEHFELQNAVDTIGPSDIRRTARNPQIAMDGQGNFTIVWESWRDSDIAETPVPGDESGQDVTDWPDSYGIYFHQFNADGSRRTNVGTEPGFDYNANFVDTEVGTINPNFGGTQVNGSVALDVDGDFAVVWNGLGAEPDPLYSTNPALVGNFDATGVFIRYFTSSAGPNIATYKSQQQRVNVTEGGVQQFPTIAMEPDGDLVVVWSGAGVGDQHGLFFRRYDEASDSAGPLVTQLQQTNGTLIDNGGQVIDTMQYVVVTFDEDLTRDGFNGVLNLANWSLLKNGVKLAGGISEVQFGLNQSKTMGLTQEASNKWEAVLKLDGNGAAAGTPALGGGQYQILISNAIRDVVGNALGRTGYAPQGASASLSFYLVPPTGDETPIGTPTSGGQKFLDPTGDPDMVPNSPRALAGDADGEHVVVWTSSESGKEGVWARVYRTEWSGTAKDRVSSTPTLVKEFPVTTNVTDSYAAVARDADGDFIVTWSRYDADDSDGLLTGWDVYFQRFNAKGEAIDAAPRMANIETEFAQRYAAVAMDVDGDFVITWQSEDQDGSGYGVYAQVYSRSGEAVGGGNEIQVVSFQKGTSSATFTLVYDEDGDDQNGYLETGPITYTGNLEQTAARIEEALGLLGIDVDVEVLNETELAIQFTGDQYGRRDVAPLVVMGGDSKVQLRVATEGVSSEFRVNDTTAGDQLFPSVAMDAQGSAVVSWTSFGQDGDAPNESNIYAKRLPSHDILAQATGTSGSTAQSSGTGMGVPLIITSTNDPNNVIVPSGTGFDGVVMVSDTAGGMGSGSLLTTGRHILTAAHVVVDAFVNPTPAQNLTVTFDLPTGPVTVGVSQVFVHPNYDGNILNGSDLAILVLANDAPAGAERYDIYRNTNEVGRVFEKYGYGNTGVGATGEDAALPSGIRRGGENRFEATGAIFNIDPGILVYDFDNGNAANDAFGVLFGMNNTGLGDREICSAHGDSGGPSFLNGLIAGVTSGGFWRSDFTTDIDNTPGNSSFGEVGLDVRVSAFATWIDAIVGGSSPEFLVNTTVVGDQKWSSVAMDLDGDYVITWTSHNQNGTSNGPGDGFIDQNAILARRFNSDNSAVAAEFQVNTYEAENQQHSHVAMDADGDFMITWESLQESTGGAANYGIYAQRYAATSKLTDPFVGVDGRIGTEIHVNSTTLGEQRMPSILLSHAGDAIIAWTGPVNPAKPNETSVFTQRFNVLTDLAGPIVTDVVNIDVDTGKQTPVLEGDTVDNVVSKFVVIFGEKLNTKYSASGPNSILNPNNWKLAKDGKTVQNAVKTVTFGLNALTNKYEAVITLDGDPNTTGDQPLEDGDYTLTIDDNVTDIFDSSLDGNYDGTPGGDYTLNFTVLVSGTETRVNTDPNDKQVFMDETLPIDQTPNSPQTVAADADGDYAVVWTDRGHVTDEVQSIHLDVNAWGKFALKYNNLRTGDIAYAGDAGATAAALQAELNALGLTTQVVALPGGLTIEVRFTGTAAGVDHPQLVVVPAATNDISQKVSVTTDVPGGVTADAGVFVKLYDVHWSLTADEERVSTVTEREPKDPSTGNTWADKEIRVTANPTATYASIAMDADGDFVVTWSQNDGTTVDPDWNVYARRYDAMGNALGGEFRVNAQTKNAQRYSTVAIDHDGEFVIAWQSEGQDGNGQEVYAQAYDRFGKALGVLDEVQVVTVNATSHGTFRLVYKDASNVEHTTADITYNGDLAGTAQAIKTQLAVFGLEVEVEPQAPTDIEIRFTGKDAGKDHRQLLVSLGTITGVTVQTQQQGRAGEFRVNQNAEGDQVYASVAMDARGNFVVTWTSYDKNKNDGDNSNIYARQFVWIDSDNKTDAEDTFVGGNEFLVNQALPGEQRWSDVAMDQQGDFVVTWTSVAEDPNNEKEQTGADGLQDVFARRYTFVVNPAGTAPVDNTPVAGEFRVNSFVRGTQQHSTVDMDADGDFVIAWESFQDVPGTSGNQPNSLGVYAQAYVRNSQLGVAGGPNGEIGVERGYNGTKVGSQRLPGVALDDTGDMVIVWSGKGEVLGQEDDQGIFMRRQNQDVDVAGPTVTDVLYLEEPPAQPATLEVVLDDSLIYYNVRQFVIVFGEDLNVLYGDIGAHSIFNPAFWQLRRNGKVLEDGITSIVYGLDQAYKSGLADAPSGKYEAVLTFDADATTPGQQALDNGLYVLTLDDAVQDLLANRLDGNLDGTPSFDFEHQFTIRVGEEGDVPVSGGHTEAETPGAVAVDADGDYIVTWTVFDAQAGVDRVVFRQFNAQGGAKADQQFVTLSAEYPDFASDRQGYASVATDADGDFIVTWTNYRDTDNNKANGFEEVDVYARRFTSSGDPASDPFRVNTYTKSDQKWSSVAMDVDGDFVVTWSSYGQEDNGQNGFGFGVYARRYDAFGRAYGPEFRVNTTTAGDQQLSSVAMDATGAFVVVWQSDQNGSGDDIVGRAFNADGSPAVSPLGGEFIVNDTIAGNQRYPDIAMNLGGDTYVVTWSSSQGTDDRSGFGVYTKTFNRITATEQNVRYAYDGDPIDFGEGQTINVPIVVDQPFQIRDLNVRLTISHEDPSDLFVWLVSPSGTRVRLFSQVPRQGDADGSTTGGANGVDFDRTVLDDEADVPIIAWQNGALPPFTGEYRPEEPLTAFDGENALGTWILQIEDRDPPADPDIIIIDGIPFHEADGGRFRACSLDFVRDPAASAETLVNTTTQGNQLYSSVTMDHQGNFVVAWCGYGNQKDQEDTSEYGVFTQRFNAAASPQGKETRLNVKTQGMQWLPSIGSDGEGNFVAVWTGPAAQPGATDVFQYVSVAHDIQEDVDGPIVADVFTVTGPTGAPVVNRLLDGGVATAGLSQILVTFGEELSVRQTVVQGTRTPAIESVLNTSNWILERNGVEVLGGVSGVTFGLNVQTGRYEAVVTLDNNGVSAGKAGLEAGAYVLTIRDLIEDLSGNALDGDYDGVPGTDPNSSGYNGFQLHFSISPSGDVLGPEARVNQTPEVVQILSQPQGTGFAREVTGMSVAVDHDGDYVVVWTAYSQDNPSDTDVYVRLYNRNNEPITNQTRVNRITAGNQREATVAMDADGDFIVVWQSQASNGTWDIYAQRFDAKGNRIANSRTNRLATDPYRNVAGKEDIEVLVNTTVIGEQFNPAVAMDSYGNYVIVWGNAGQAFSYFHTVEAQRFNYRGETMGAQFQVNVSSLPGASGPGLASSFTVNPTVDLDDSGRMVVAWDRITVQTSGVVTDTDVVARVFDALSRPVTGEVVVNAAEIISPDPTHEDPEGAAGGTDVARNARNPQVAMDPAGNFIVVFEAYQDNDYAGTDAPDSYGIYYRRFDSLGNPLTEAVQQANTVVTTDSDGPVPGTTGDAFAYDQVNPTIAIDADGDFAIFWNGNGAQPDPLDIENLALVSNQDRAGVFGRWFHSGTASALSVPSTVQQRANRTVAGIQQFPSVAMEPDGDSLVVWAGSGVGDQHGIFVRHYDEATDTAGPMATELRLADASLTLVGPGDNVFLPSGNPQKLLVVFDEKLNTDLTGPGGTPGLHSVENVNNWALVNGRGDELVGAILSVQFRFNEALNKWVAEVTFRGANGAAGPLANGQYTLVARTAIQDLAGNALARTGYQPYGTGIQYDAQGNPLPLDPATSPTGGFGFRFRVNNTVPGNASWGDVDQMVSNPTTTYGQNNLALVTYQNDSAVARNATGQYVVVWVEYSQVVDSTLLPPDPNADPNATLPIIPATPVLEANIMAQRFDAKCRELGAPILVNSLTAGDQLQPAVGIDDQGNFVVIWSGNGTALSDATGIFGQRFDADGVAQGGQFRVNDYLNSIQDEPAVAVNPNTGDFVVTWASFGQDGNRDGVYARRYRANGQAYGAEFLVNTATTGDQTTPDIAMDAAGNFVIVWAGGEQDASGWGIFAQRFAANGTRLGTEFRVNSYQSGDQVAPAVARDRQGNFVVTWTSRQDGGGLGVYAQRYNASGVKQGTEFRVNTTTVYDQFEPDVAMSAEGIFVVTWTSFLQDTPYDENLRDWGVYARMYNANGTDYVDARVGTSPIGEFRVNAQTTGNQYRSSVSMDAAGHYIVSWTGLNSTITVPDTAGTGTVSQDVSAIYSRFIDPPVQTQSSTTPVDVSILGTAGNDVFEFIGGPTVGTWIVKLNGESLSLGSSVGTVRFEGRGGQDTVVFGGSSADDRVELWADHGTFTSQYYSLEVSQVEIITAAGAVGTDTVILHDSTGDDLLVVNPQSATFTGTGLNLTASGFESIQAKADGGGSDTVQIYDSSGNDTFNATPACAEMVASGYYVKAESFEYAKGYSTAGTDTANLYDSAGDDHLVATAAYGKLYGQGFFSMATGFRHIRAYGNAGGNDVATMSGSAGTADTFEAHPNYAKLYGGTYYHRADNFETIQATGQDGDEDTAILYGSTGDDTFIAGRHYGRIFGAGYDTRADFFRYVTGYGEGGYDVAQLYDSPGDDTLTTTPLYGQLGGSDYQNRVYGFDRVDIRAMGGGHDVGDLFDSALADYLEGEKDWARLSNTDLGFAYWVSGFDKVTAKSSSQGDRKRISPEASFLFATGLWQDV